MESRDSRVDEALLRHRFDGGERELFVPLADLARRSGQLELARELLGSGLDEFPERVSAWVLASRVEAQSGHLKEAGRLYLQVIELDPGNLPALRSLAAAALAVGESGQALGLTERWLAEDPADPEAEDLLAELLEPAGGEPRPLAPLPPGSESAIGRALSGAREQPSEGKDIDA